MSCDLEVSERTNLKVDKVLSFLPAEGEGNYDLSSPLPQPCLFSGQQGTTISLVPHPPILFLIFTCTQMRLLCFSKTVRETKNEGELGSWEERGSLHGEQRETEYAKGRLGHEADMPGDVIKCTKNPDISKLWQIRQGDPFQPTSGSTRNMELSFVND